MLSTRCLQPKTERKGTRHCTPPHFQAVWSPVSCRVFAEVPVNETKPSKQRHVKTMVLQYEKGINERDECLTARCSSSLSERVSENHNTSTIYKTTKKSTALFPPALGVEESNFTWVRKESKQEKKKEKRKTKNKGCLGRGRKESKKVSKKKKKKNRRGKLTDRKIN